MFLFVFIRMVLSFFLCDSNVNRRQALRQNPSKSFLNMIKSNRCQNRSLFCHYPIHPRTFLLTSPFAAIDTLTCTRIPHLEWFCLEWYIVIGAQWIPLRGYLRTIYNDNQPFSDLLLISRLSWFDGSVVLASGEIWCWVQGWRQLQLKLSGSVMPMYSVFRIPYYNHSQIILYIVASDPLACGWTLFLSFYFPFQPVLFVNAFTCDYGDVELAVFVFPYAYLRWIIAFTGFSNLYLPLDYKYAQTHTHNFKHFQLFRLWKNCFASAAQNFPNRVTKLIIFILFLVLNVVPNLWQPIMEMHVANQPMGCILFHQSVLVFEAFCYRFLMKIQI